MIKNTQKNWQVMPKFNDELSASYPDLSGVVLQLLFNRGLSEKKDIDLFLVTDYEKNAIDPFLFNDMEKAVELIVKHIKEGSKITVYGDYDADGVTSSALLVEALSVFKARASVYIPDRVSEGYGLNKDAIDELSKDDTKLIITVDGGIRSKEEVRYAKELGLDVVITDHHVPPSKEELPDCLIINPLVAGEKYSYKFLAGVGVAFKLAVALIQKSKLEDADKKKLEERILDLVAIGTVTDCVSLLGENRVLVKKGLEILNKTKRIGLKELIASISANGNNKLQSWNIGFQIGPRLNAAGRMDHANTAFELLVTRDKDEAKMIARRLNDKNIERQATTEEISKQVSAQADLQGEDKKIIIAVTGEEKIWNEGVVGLVAGRVSDKYYLPALVITKGEEGFKGSGRSIDEFNLIEAIEKCADLLIRFGGHPAACGFSLKEENLEKFKERMKILAEEKLKNIDLAPKIEIEAELNLEEVNEKLLEDISAFEPFGENNMQPKFLSRGVEIFDIITMGISGQHIKLRLKSHQSSTFSAVGFSQAEKWQNLKIGDKIDLVYYLDKNEFNGRTEIQMKILDIKL